MNALCPFVVCRRWARNELRQRHPVLTQGVFRLRRDKMLFPHMLTGDQESHLPHTYIPMPYIELQSMPWKLDMSTFARL